MKILAVDDDPFFLEVLNAALEALGFQDVTLSESAAEAAELIADAEEFFDCFLIDMTMPDIEGDYLCRWIRRQPGYQDTPVVMITAKSKKADIDKAFLAGATDYVTKPLDLDDLRIRLGGISRSMTRSKDLQAASPQRSYQFSDPRLPAGVRGVIELGAMENYLLQLARAQMYKMSAFAFSISNAAALFRHCTPAVFEVVLALAAKVIQLKLGRPGLVMSYAGYGAFVCLAADFELDEQARGALEADITQTLRTGLAASKHDIPDDISVSMSLPLNLGIWSGSKVVDAMYRTIGDAEARGAQMGVA